MTHTHLSRRDAMLSALGVSMAAASAHAQTGDKEMAAIADAHRHDWDWLEGRWNVRHRRLKTRLANDTEWEEFDGSCDCRITMNGLGNCDDNVVEIPSGTYRAMGIRAFNPATGKWAIWWLDERSPDRIEPPVYGSFENGVGRFEGDDTFNGQAIRVYFQWSDITATSARWEQAFSTDRGATWEVNWVMHFTRA
jgi:hypothetical protein